LDDKGEIMFILKLHHCLKINIIKTERIKITHKPKAVLKSVATLGCVWKYNHKMKCQDSEKQQKAKQHYLVGAKFQMQPIQF